MAGYDGFAMSNNARAAYADGEKPLSKWTKAEILAQLSPEAAERLKPLTVAELRDSVLVWTSWHHTSSKYNRTDFYSVDSEKADELTAEQVAEIIGRRKQREKKSAEQPKDRRARVRFTVWVGNYRNYRRPKDIEEVVTIPANGGMVQTSEGAKRQSSLTILEWLD